MVIRSQIYVFFKLAFSDLAPGHRRSRALRGERSGIESLESSTLLTTYSVTNLNDAGAGSLRDAISQANANSGADTITFATSPSTGTISLTSGPLQISDSLTITGPGADKRAISGGNQAFNVINIDDGQASLLDVSISGLTVRNGGDGTTFINGAGIFSRENLTLDGVALLNNNAGLWLQVEAISLRRPGGVGGASV